MILGHTHYQMAERIGGVLVINPGSAGEARDPRNPLRFKVLHSPQAREARLQPPADPRPQ